MGKTGTVFRAKGPRRFQRVGAKSSLKLFPDQFNAEIAAAAREHRVDPALVRAVIHAESSFNPRAVSPKGAKGLMQLMPSPARSLGVDDPFEPGDNIRGGTNLLADLKRKFNGNVRLALAAYNAGEGAVRRHNGIPPYRETQDYVAKVLRLRAAYSGVRLVGDVTAG
jgi:soluble lytic murein transglycosylase-like protein